MRLQRLAVEVRLVYEARMAHEADDARLTDLEIKVSYLEKLIAELDEVVQEQATVITRLSAELDRQRQQFSMDTSGAPADDKPPHY